MLDEIKQRLTMPTPAFWKKLQKRAAATAGLFGTLTVTVASLSSHLPAIVPQVFAFATAFFGGIAAICSLAVDDPAALTAPPAPVEPLPTYTQPEAP
ncbi:hypothetical protein, partial [Hymenobacter psychrophilus]